MLRLQNPAREETEALKELGKALRQGDTTTTVARHTDAQLIALLQRCQKPSRVWQILLIVSVVSVLINTIGSLLHLWKLPFFSFFGIFGFSSVFQNGIAHAKPEAWEPVKQRLERAELPTLLDALALNIPALTDAIRAGLSAQLSTATTDALEDLTAVQRQQLVRFVRAQLNASLWATPLGKAAILSDAQIQAATVGLLALATLKQPGAERLDWRVVRGDADRLRAAHQEYLASLPL
jgi:hypothetical protein